MWPGIGLTSKALQCELEGTMENKTRGEEGDPTSRRVFCQLQSHRELPCGWKLSQHWVLQTAGKPQLKY